MGGELCAQVEQACRNRLALCLRGTGSKAFYGREPRGQVLDLSPHRGVLSYEPSELVVRARAGTPLAEIEAMLAAERQMLAFEPPRFGGSGTLGGAVATGLSGPRRPFSGAARDFVLGAGLINGRGERLGFGGQVMKNVAGYDLSRLMCGALGTLGVLTEVSLKVLPRPEIECTLVQPCSQPRALERLERWNSQPLPLSAACWHEDQLYLRLSGSEAGVQEAQRQLGTAQLLEDDDWWPALRDHRHPFFQRQAPLWRLSVPPATAPLALTGEWLIDWAGGQRWLYSEEDPARIRTLTCEAGGHASLFRGGDRRGTVFQPLPPALMALHRRLKQALDPAGILNPGRLYEDF
ncbi:MAG TPA: glycolate oxidase subunit GlcE [Gammaproteobacteria bacterium]|nr:glycolate oxidase subunit GlcE [Gammaproteobacteria bacterium]